MSIQSIPAVEPPISMTSQLLARQRPTRHGMFVTFLPCIAIAIAFVVHRNLPNLQTSLPMAGRYPALLLALLVLTLVGGIVATFWPSMRLAYESKAPLITLVVVILCIWDLVTLKLGWLALPYFPGPDMVLRGLVGQWSALLHNASSSLMLLSMGYAIGTLSGLFSGISMGWSSKVRYWGMPVLKFIGPIPATALIPLAMAVFSNSFLSGAALIGLAVWFPVTMLTASGISNVRASYLDVARTLGAGRLYLIFKVALPAAMPSIFIGLFMGLGAAFLTLIAAETVGVSAGLGYYVRWRQAYCEYDKVYAALLVMAVFFSCVMTLLFKIRDHILVWQKGVIKW